MRVILSVLIMLVAFSAQAEVAPEILEAIQYNQANPENRGTNHLTGEKLGAFKQDFQGYAVVYGWQKSGERDANILGADPLTSSTFEDAFEEIQFFADYMSMPFNLYYIDLVNGIATNVFDQNGCIMSDRRSGRVYTAVGMFYSKIPGATFDGIDVMGSVDSLPVVGKNLEILNATDDEMMACRGAINN
ncbi:MAG: hypothetical protein HRT44_08760 [Bdellovibrionales bacterium]|nr:hypothetical protein [Bdellovibrionales bacterium]NQZ19331.1 hypothetical protein [Bdellovibrionales bacterium]